MFIPVEVRDSAIFGKGLFAMEPVPKGRVVCFFALGGQVITERNFVDAVAREVYPIVRSGTRYVGKYFTYLKETREGDDSIPENFFNHSFTPNLLCHCGIVLAKCDIPAGEELTLDYRYLVDSTDVGVYNDAKTGRPIRGLSARDTLLETARQLIAIVEGLEDWEG